jgi:serine protease Do
MRQLFASLLVLFALSAAQASEVSEALFAKHRTSVFQIRLIDSSANQKKSLGSGFKVGEAGLVATNYHVISDSVYEKDRYRIEAVDDKNVHHTMTLRAVDVVHDLALLAFDKPQPEVPSLAINVQDMLQGESVFSLGNPHDIGMMIVAGNTTGWSRIRVTSA